MKSNKAFPEQRDALDALDLAIKHIRGKGDKFSERNPTAVLSQLEGTCSRISHALTNPAVPSVPEALDNLVKFARESPRFCVDNPSSVRNPERLAEVIRRAIAQSGEGRIPEGWKLVPVEPTERMLQAADESDSQYTTRQFGPQHPRLEQGGAYDHYVAMLAAAPEPGPEKNDG